MFLWVFCNSGSTAVVQKVVLGQVLTGGIGQNPARQAAIKANLPINKTAYIINQVCGSGLRSIAAGYQSIVSKDSNIIIAGGQESMSKAPYVTDIRDKKKFKKKNLIDSMIKDGLWDAFNDYHMGVTAENVAQKWKINRKEQDQFAFESQQKTKKAQDDNKFSDEIIPINIKFNSKKFADNDRIRDDVVYTYKEKVIPTLPIGADLLMSKFQIPEGKTLGNKLKRIEEIWVQNGFQISDKQVQKIAKG